MYAKIPPPPQLNLPWPKELNAARLHLMACSKTMFISKGSYGYGELKNVIVLPILMVQCLHLGNVYLKSKLRVWRA